MKKEEKVRLPYVPTYGEEVANTVSHAVMLPLTLCLLPFAAVWTYLHLSLIHISEPTRPY